MSDKDQLRSTDDGFAARSGGIGSSIVDTMKMSLARLSGDPNEDVRNPYPETQLGNGADNDISFGANDKGAQMTASASAGTEPTNQQLTHAAKSKAPAQRTRGARQARRARLRISRVDPWSVMKTALLLGVACWIILIVSTWIIFTVLDKTGLYNAINDTVGLIFNAPDAPAFNIKDYVNTTRATALAALVGAVDVILITALATIFGFLYNLTANVMGGIEVTMAED